MWDSRVARYYIVLGFIAGAFACGDGHDDATPTPSVERLSGVYDTNTGWLAVVSGRGNSLRLVIGDVAETATEVSGVIHGDGSVDLTGEQHAQDMGHPPITGHAVVTESEGEFRIAGTIGESAVTLVRPVLGTSQAFNGAYIVAFDRSLAGADEPTSTPFLLDVAPDGRTRSVPDTAEIGGSQGQVFGTLSEGECFLSPRLLVSCRFRYARTSAEPSPLGGRFDVVLVGSLNHPSGEEAVVGSGSVVATNVPPITLHVLPLTGWRATRVGDLGEPNALESPHGSTPLEGMR